MMTRSRAFALIAEPMAVRMTAADAGVRRRGALGQMLVSRSGVDLTSLDRTADPCSDFYQFTCGGWMASHPAPPDQPRYGRFEELQDRNNLILKDILEEAAKPASAAELRKVGDYYGSCMAEAAIEAKGTAPLAPDLSRVAAVKDKADIPAGVVPQPGAGVAGWFGFGAAPDLKD